MDGMWYFDKNGQRNSLCFRLGKPDITGHLEATIGLKVMCNDSRSTCDDPTFKPTESSRDLLLLLTLETTEFGVILSRRSITIWPKAVVRPKDLNKPERRKPKGGAAKLNKIKEMMEKPTHCDQQARYGSLEVNDGYKKIASRETLKLVPKLNFIGQSRTLNPSA